MYKPRYDLLALTNSLPVRLRPYSVAAWNNDRPSSVPCRCFPSTTTYTAHTHTRSSLCVTRPTVAALFFASIWRAPRRSHGSDNHYKSWSGHVLKSAAHLLCLYAVALISLDAIFTYATLLCVNS